MTASGQPLPRRIAHFDLDSFFVAVERARNADLRGKPVLVGYPGPRGVVATASYEARKFGCRSAQPMVQAMRLCPQAIVVPPDFAAYSQASEHFHDMLRDVSPVVESVGIDEAYADLTGTGDPETGARAAAEGIRDRVRQELDLAVSVCIAGSRTVAKVGSDHAKPDGLIEVPVGEDAAFLAPFPIRELPFVGPRLGEVLQRAGIRTIGQAAALDPRWAAAAFGRGGETLVERARGIDPTPVHGGAREHKQISRETTFGTDVTQIASLRQTLQRQAERVGADLRREQRRARTVTLKLRWSDFTTLTRSRTLERAFRGTTPIVEVAQALLDETVRVEGFRPVRLIGVAVSNLVEDAMQLELSDMEGDAAGAPRILREERLDRVIDDLRERFGDRSVTRGA